MFSAHSSRRYNVVYNAETHFPFLTAQWKSAIFGENQVHASLQAARDGALIVNYMHQFYSLAYPNRPPTQLQTCHFSTTTEIYTYMLWIHWREVDPDDGEVYFRMEEVETARMNKLEDVREVRKILHNYLDFSLGERYYSSRTSNCTSSRSIVRLMRLSLRLYTIFLIIWRLCACDYTQAFLLIQSFDCFTNCLCVHKYNA
jgi:hypothetical protein